MWIREDLRDRPACHLRRPDEHRVAANPGGREPVHVGDDVAGPDVVVVVLGRQPTLGQPDGDVGDHDHREQSGDEAREPPDSRPGRHAP